MSRIAYVDSSVVASALMPDEALSDRVRQWIASSTMTLVSSVILQVEVGRLLHRHTVSPHDTAEVHALLTRLTLTEVSEQIRLSAIAVKPSRVSSSDAIHIATALIGEVDEFASLDKVQALGAQEMGLTLAKI